MNHAITIGGLLLSLGVLVGLAMTAFGALAIFAGGMSDAPEAGADTTRQGCMIALPGAMLLAMCIIGLVL